MLTAALLILGLGPTIQTFDVDGVKRQALAYHGTSAHPPLLLVFHGHGGSMNQAARSFDAHELWPEATVIYPDGLPTKGRTDPNGTRKGWQVRPDALGDRDLNFVDAILKSIKDRRGSTDLPSEDAGDQPSIWAE